MDIFVSMSDFNNGKAEDTRRKGVRNRATHWIKQFHGHGEAVTTAKA